MKRCAAALALLCGLVLKTWPVIWPSTVLVGALFCASHSAKPQRKAALFCCFEITEWIPTDCKRWDLSTLSSCVLLFCFWIVLTEYTSAALKHKVHLYTFLCIDQCRMYNYCLARHSKFILMNRRQEPYIKDNLLLLFSSTTIYGVFPGYFEILLAKVKAFLFAAGRVSGCSRCWFPCFQGRSGPPGLGPVPVLFLVTKELNVC